MKKFIILSIVLCFSASSIKQIKPLIFAESNGSTSLVNQNSLTKDDNQYIVEENNLTKNDSQALVEQNDSAKDDSQTLVEQSDSAKDNSQTLVEQSDSAKDDSQIPIEQSDSAKDDNQTPVEQNDSAKDDSQAPVEQNVLTQEQAKELLIKYNNKVNYIYQGSENDFEALKAKNLHGYVFLPDVDTDIGFFVNKETSEIYFFHPSGYLELAQ